MAKEDILYRKEDGTGIITFNRPDKLNAVTSEMVARLGELCAEVKLDNSVRAVILTGNGRAFCAGTDISSGGIPPTSMDRAIAEEEKKVSTYDHGTSLFYNSIISIAKPTVCAINGAAAGLGSELTLQCDVRIAARSARWGQVFVLRGILPDTGAGTYLLPRIVGLAKACELVFSGEVIDADEMLRIGLVSKVVPDDQLIPVAMEMVKKLTRGAPLAIQGCKQLMYQGFERTFEEHQKVNMSLLGAAFRTEDFKEGVRSFLEKREARWTGK